MSLFSRLFLCAALFCGFLQADECVDGGVCQIHDNYAIVVDPTQWYIELEDDIPLAPRLVAGAALVNQPDSTIYAAFYCWMGDKVGIASQEQGLEYGSFILDHLGPQLEYTFTREYSGSRADGCVLAGQLKQANYGAQYYALYLRPAEADSGPIVMLMVADSVEGPDEIDDVTLGDLYDLMISFIRQR